MKKIEIFHQYLALSWKYTTQGHSYYEMPIGTPM